MPPHIFCGKKAVGARERSLETKDEGKLAWLTRNVSIST